MHCWLNRFVIFDFMDQLETLSEEETQFWEISIKTNQNLKNQVLQSNQLEKSKFQAEFYGTFSKPISRV